jgi:hypothetical protein
VRSHRARWKNNFVIASIPLNFCTVWTDFAH